MGSTFTVVQLRQSIDAIDPYTDEMISVARAMDDLELSTKKASKPADPAFKNALRRTRMQIGLRYVGD